MSVALIYATWNRGALLEKSLRRLAQLTVPDEILVIDDGSHDSTAQVCQAAIDEHHLPVRWIYNHRPYEAMCSQAKNVGIRSTDADTLIFSEPEMYFETDVVAQMVAARAAHPESLINAGTIYHEQLDSRPCWCCGQPRHVTVNWQALWIAAFDRQWLVDVGGWDEQFPDPWGWDDTDLGTRLRINGVGQYNDLEIQAAHMWHQPRAHNQARNEQYFKNKSFNGNESVDHPKLVANQGIEWGRVVTP